MRQLTLAMASLEKHSKLTRRLTPSGSVTSILPLPKGSNLHFYQTAIASRQAQSAGSPRFFATQ